ncbi:MAG: UDP-N-acetylmuramate--L-alanine ligase [Pseudomonadota bacterium]
MIGVTHLGRKRFKVHFVGIGGIGMSGIAEVLVNLGYEISGSDLKESETTERLSSLGAKVCCGSHRPDNVAGSDVVVVSSAVRLGNTEVEEATRRGIPVIPRAEMLAEIMRLKESIAISGTHGKTTTTSLMATILAEAGWDPTVVVGGRLNALGKSAAVGKGDWMVAEADESDGSFLKLSPSIAVITNIDPEHLDHYHSVENLHKAFIEFANKVPFYGFTMLCLDHPAVQSILPKVTKKFFTYGLSIQADYRGEEIRYGTDDTSFELIARGKPLGAVTVKLIGAHNVLNTLASMGVALELGIPFAAASRAIASFEGVSRRFTILGEFNGALLVDDYAHHPVEIKATLEAAHAAHRGKNIIAVFQPHRYSRVQLLHEEFEKAFNRASEVVVTDIYAAGEDPATGVSAARLAENIRSHGHHNVTYLPMLPQVVDHLEKKLGADDLVISLGAGDVSWVLKELLKRL